LRYIAVYNHKFLCVVLVFSSHELFRSLSIGHFRRGNSKREKPPPPSFWKREPSSKMADRKGAKYIQVIKLFEIDKCIQAEGKFSSFYSTLKILIALI
jgi:hypothetical protein